MKWEKYEDWHMMELSDHEAITIDKSEGYWSAVWELARNNDTVLCRHIVVSRVPLREAKRYCEFWVHNGRIDCIKNKMVEISGDLGVLSRALGY